MPRLRRLAADIHRRSVWQVLGIYLAAGWGLLEFLDWIVARFDLPAVLTTGALIVLAAGLPAVAVLAWRWGGTAMPAGPPAERTSVAVLPFANISADPDDAFLSDGFSEEIITALSRVEGLRVASRTSAFAYREGKQDVRRIGRELGVGSVLEGSVQRSGNRIRVTTQLVNAEDGYHLWSRRFDREMEDVFAIEDEIAASVARTLRVILSDADRAALRRPVPADIRAYEYLLRGQQFLHQWRMRSIEHARTMFRRAIEVDPDYALAWSGLAEAGAVLRMYYPARYEDLEEADRASSRALELAPELADAHAVRGLVLFLMDRPRQADERFVAAIARDPRLFQARYYYARACFQRGWMDEAARQFLEAARIQDSVPASFFAAQSMEALGQHQEALEQYARALAVAETHMDLNPDDPRAATMRAVSLCRIGRPEEGLEWAERALELDPDDAGVRYNAACLFALEGQAERALDCIEAAIQRGFTNREWFEKDPDLASLRDHPRFQIMMDGIDGGDRHPSATPPTDG